MGLPISMVGKLNAYVVAGKSFEDFVKGQEIEPEDTAEAAKLWDNAYSTFKNLKPGESMMSPVEWS